MMGERQWSQDRLFYEFDLEAMVPGDHLLRQIDAVLDLSGLREKLAPHYSHTGRPSIDPELMIRMLLIGYCYGIRSERRLCEEVKLNLAYRWFCRLGIEDQVPDHSSFSKNCHGRFRDADILRHVFEATVRSCMEAGLVEGEGFAVDASVMRADANRQNHVKRQDVDDHDWTDGPGGGPSRPVREYLNALDKGAKTPKEISLSDPASRLTASVGKPAFFGWSTNYLIDVKNAVIMDVAATPTIRNEEVASTKNMIDRVETRFGIKPKRLIGDTAYGVAAMLDWTVNEKGIEPHVNLWEKGEKRADGTFPRAAFPYDPATDTMTCPGGKTLRLYNRTFAKPRSGTNKDGFKRYNALQSDCAVCALKEQCCPGQPRRKVTRSVHEEARDIVRRLQDTPEYLQSRRDRKKVEMLFAHLKRIMRFDRLQLRGPTGVTDEFTLAAAVQNLRKLAKLTFQPNKAAPV